MSINDLILRLDGVKTKLNYSQKIIELTDLKNQSLDSSLWNNPQKAGEIMQSISDLDKLVKSIDDIESDLKNLIDFNQLITTDPDPNLEIEIDNQQKIIDKQISQLELQTYLSGKYDKSYAILSVHSGQGGTEAMDWASILQRMYMRFFERKNWQFELLDITLGEEAGIKSVYFKINIPFAYGYLQSENGVHRLVRISPFDGESLRQTSFALVEVMPELPDSAGIEVRDEDLKIDVYRSSGPGGQNVNKTESAIRITHIPSGIVVACQTERSQHQNREIAMKILYAKLYQLALEERSGELQKIKGATQIAAWGRQIRSYVLQPYQMVKDHRTEYETSNVSGVFDGDLKAFMEEYLRFKKNKEKI